jgi:hypothetical protein
MLKLYKSLFTYFLILLFLLFLFILTKKSRETKETYVTNTEWEKLKPNMETLFSKATTDINTNFTTLTTDNIETINHLFRS